MQPLLPGLLAASLIVLTAACSGGTRVAGHYEWKGASPEELLAHTGGPSRLTALLESAGEVQPASFSMDLTEDHRFTLKWRLFGETHSASGIWNLRGDGLQFSHDISQTTPSWALRLNHARLEDDRLVVKGSKGLPAFELTRRPSAVGTRR